MTSNQIAYWGNVIKADEAATRARQHELDQERFKLEKSQHLHEYGEIYSKQKSNNEPGTKEYEAAGKLVSGIGTAVSGISKVINPLSSIFE